MASLFALMWAIFILVYILTVKIIKLVSRRQEEQIEMLEKTLH